MDLNEFCIKHYKNIVKKEKRRIYNKKYRRDNKDKIHKQKTISRWKDKFNCKDTINYIKIIFVIKKEKKI